MKQCTVVANKGFESAPMPYDRASLYAERLRQLGNVNVWVRIQR